MPCKTVKIGDRAAIVCSRRKYNRPRCSACGGKGVSVRCDFPIEERTCDKWLCRRCAVKVGDDRDHCPDHPRIDARGML